MTSTINVTNRKKGERKDGMTPAVFYGAHAAATPIFVDTIEFKKLLKTAGESSIVALTGDAKVNVLIHDVQMDPVMYVPTHVDFYVVEKGQKVHVNIHLNFIGESPAVKNLGANLVKVMHEISVEAEGSDIPQEIEVDISTLDTLNSNILVKDIKLPLGTTLYHMQENEVVASVVSQSEEDLSAPVAEVDMTAVEVEKKGKKEDESAVEA